MGPTLEGDVLTALRPMGQRENRHLVASVPRDNSHIRSRLLKSPVGRASKTEPEPAPASGAAGSDDATGQHAVRTQPESVPWDSRWKATY